MTVQRTNTHRLGGICLPTELHTADMTKATQQSTFVAASQQHIFSDSYQASAGIEGTETVVKN